MEQSEKAQLKAEKKALKRKMYRCINVFWMCSLLGLIGGHRFYIGKIFTGFLQLITLGGLGIWWGIDLYKIIRGRFKDRKGNVISWYVPDSIEGQHNFADFRIRVTAMLIDGYVISAILLPITIPLVVFAIISDLPKEELDAIDGINNLLYYILGFIYSIYFHASLRQGTLGKRAVGIYVINSDGQRISYLNAFGRYLATIVSALTLCIGFFMAGWTKKKRALHDIIAGTYVVYGKPSDAIVRP